MILSRMRDRKPTRENLPPAERARLRASIESEGYMERAIASTAESLLLGQRSLAPFFLVREREQRLQAALRKRANILDARASNVQKDGVR